jgi:hypothetical protein
MRALCGPSPLCDAVSLPPVPRCWERPVSPHAALPCVAPFPPAALRGHPTPCTSSAFLPLRLSGILPCRGESAGPPGLPCNPKVKHAMVSDPGEADTPLPLTGMPIATSAPSTASPFPSRRLRGSIPSTLRLTACLLAVLRLKQCVATLPPRTRYPVAGQPSGAGFPPAGLRDLARPHAWSDLFTIISAP